MDITPQCFLCKRYYRFDEKLQRHTCEAFPQGIAADVMDNRRRHDKPIESDHGLRFVPVKGWENFWG
jgi:hypothetical protein